MKTELKDRTLWYDGTNQVDPGLVPELLLEGVPLNKIVVSEMNDDLILFNTLEDVDFPKSKQKNDPLDMSWNIPKKYAEMDLGKYLNERLVQMGLNTNPKYVERLAAEMTEVEVRGVSMLLKTLVFVLDTFRENKTVWGVGRGSSCASLVLFVMGLHKVDPVKFNIPLTEFFHD
jgi:DNA polymerase III alpha subunit